MVIDRQLRHGVSSRINNTALFVTLTLLLLSASAGAQFGPARVETALVVEKEIKSGASYVGTAAPLRSSTVGSEAAGKVVELLVEEGDRVAANQPLARLKTDTFEIELAAANALLRLREAELAELRNGSRPEEIKQARASVRTREADVAYWTSQKERVFNLFKDKVRSEEQVQDAQRWLERAQQESLEARANLELLEAGTRIERIHQAEAQVDAARESVALLKDRIAKHSILAPFDGYVTAKNTEVGQWIDLGDSVVEFAELDRIEIEAAVPEFDVVNVKIGESAAISFDALPQEVFTGVVSVIVPKGDLKSRTFTVKIRVDNRTSGNETLGADPDEGVLIKEGMFARVTLSVGEPLLALLVPKDALVLGGPAPAVYVVEPDKDEPGASSVRMAPVQLGGASGNLIEVKGELKAGDQVVVLGNERLFPGQKVIASARPLAKPAVIESATQNANPAAVKKQG